MSIPNLTVINGSHAGNIFKDENYVDSNGYRRMDLYYPYGGVTQKVTSSGDNAIGYNPSTQNWKDFGQDGSGNPRDLSATTNFTGASDNVTNPEFVHIQTGNGTYFGYFANHDYSTGSGGGPGTLSNSGSLQKEGSNLRWTVSSVSQDGTYTVTESSDGGDSYSINLNVVIPNLSGFRTGLLTNFDELYMYKFYDPLENLIGSYAPTTRKKVHSNFW